MDRLVVSLVPENMSKDTKIKDANHRFKVMDKKVIPNYRISKNLYICFSLILVITVKLDTCFKPFGFCIVIYLLLSNVNDSIWHCPLLNKYVKL